MDGDDAWTMTATMLAFLVLLLLVWKTWSKADGVSSAAGDGPASFNDDGNFPFGVHEVQGRRSYMEDRWKVCGDLRPKGAAAMGEEGSSVEPLGGGWRSAATSLYGVFDGHGGDRASEFCRQRLPHNVVAQASYRSDLSEALRCGFLETDRQFLVDAAEGEFEDGTTAIVVAIRNGRYYAANAGDSRAILVKENGSVVELSHDHKPNNPEERRRVEDAGGFVLMPRGHGVWRVQVRACAIDAVRVSRGRSSRCS
jgi:protein phosphatase 1L